VFSNIDSPFSPENAPCAQLRGPEVFTACPSYGTAQGLKEGTRTKEMSMSNPEWGVKRVCPETGKRFYDLNKTPIISPYTGQVVVIETNDRRGDAAAALAKAKAASVKDVDDDDLLVDDEAGVEVDDDLLEDDDDDTVALDDLADVASDDDD
jgi:uncharacterized protein (TIGR02300 family)